jgi:uncharacterized phage protein (TIGR02218 family)
MDGRVVRPAAALFAEEAQVAGCDKRFANCRDRFANTVNSRGFPHIPGNDFVISYPLPGRAQGIARVRYSER